MTVVSVRVCDGARRGSQGFLPACRQSPGPGEVHRGSAAKCGAAVKSLVNTDDAVRPKNRPRRHTISGPVR